MRIDNLKIEALTVITSCGCNLNCEYCHIAQGVNSDSARLQSETIKALQNGDFLNNIKKSLARIEQSPGEIKMLSFWGQEPTLTLHYITEHIEDWIHTFPNCHGIMFVSNGVAYGNRIVDFLIALDKALNYEFKVEIQLSFDGTESTDNIRNADSKKIYDNISYILSELNKYNFKFLKVGFYFHGVVSINLLKRLNSQEKIINYYKNLNNWAYDLYSINLNKNVEVHPLVGIALENPVDASTEEGLLLANFYKQSIRIHPSNFKFENSHRQEWTINTLLSQYTHCINLIMEGTGFDNLDQLLQRCVEDKQFFDMIARKISLLSYCGNSYGELKLMYDGTIINCQNSIYDRDVNFIKKEENMDSYVKQAQATHHYFVNLLTDSDEVLQKHFELFRLSKENSYPFIFETTAILMFWLSQAHQIDESYTDLRKLITHAALLAYFNCCYYNNYMKTGSMFLRSTGFIRFFCNGFLDELLQNHGAWGGIEI